MYKQRILGCRSQRLHGRHTIASEVRIAIIYDSLVHSMNMIELVQKHRINYSSIRHILLQYGQSGKTDVRKYKLVEIGTQ